MAACQIAPYRLVSCEANRLNISSLNHRAGFRSSVSKLFIAKVSTVVQRIVLQRVAVLVSTLLFSTFGFVGNWNKTTPYQHRLVCDCFKIWSSYFGFSVVSLSSNKSSRSVLVAMFLQQGSVVNSMCLLGAGANKGLLLTAKRLHVWYPLRGGNRTERYISVYASR